MMRNALAIACLALLTAPAGLARAEEPADFFEKRVRPVLAARCLECHGDEAPEAGLRLTSRASVLKGGQSGPAAVPNKPGESLVIQAVSQRGKLKMPPEGKLSDAEIEALVKWVELGLPWPSAPPADRTRNTEAQHWAFRPIADPPLPTVKDTAWTRTSIDRFILAKLEAAGLQPSPPADRRTLLRRAYYDLIALPPTWEEVEAFVQDAAATDIALEKVVTRLLASPRYGERWGRHWLDVARYADTKDGVLMYGDDRIRPYAYTYRDYVIRAFNEDLPFDRFVHEQLAADLIEPKVEPWRLAAMGFLTLGRMFDNNVHDIIDDQIDTVTRGFLGLTVSCARCHDHKYDPVPTADYYSLYGVFASSEAPLELPLIESASTPAAQEFEKAAAAKREEIRKFQDEQYAMLSETARQRVGDYLVHAATTKPDPLETAIYFLSLAPEDLRPPIVARWRRYLRLHAKSDDPVFGPWADLMRLADKSGAKQDGSKTAPFASAAAPVLAEWKRRRPGTQAGEANPLVIEALSKAALNGQADVARAYGNLLKQLYEESKVGPGAAGTASPPPNEAARRQLLELVIGRDSPLYFPKSHTRLYMSRQPKDAFGGKLQELDRMAVRSPHAPPRAMSLIDAETPHEPRIFVRGNATQLGQRVPRQFLAVLSPAPRQPFGGGSGRLDLARAITSPQNPLTARVIVNRVWMHHFGEPLVATPNDFGKRSAPPVHQELLDHVATRFMADGWSLKKLHRWIMTSAVYQQKSECGMRNAELQADSGSEDSALRIPNSALMIDPDNRLLWRMNRQRLSFEAMRDTLLAVSGRLEERGGGRPVDIAGDPQARCRTVYGLIDRQSLPGVFRAFDFASPDQSAERRPRTMVPQQALFALNSPFVIEQAKAVARRVGTAHQSSGLESGVGFAHAEQVTALYRAVLCRDPSPDELTASVEFLSAPRDTTSQLGPLEQLAQVLLASNELMYVD